MDTDRYGVLRIDRQRRQEDGERNGLSCFQVDVVIVALLDPDECCLGVRDSGIARVYDRPVGYVVLEFALSCIG